VTNTTNLSVKARQSQFRIFAGCLVSEECAAYAVDEGIAVGIWGGLSGLERRRLRAQAA
jgi:hypothetical protein